MLTFRDHLFQDKVALVTGGGSGINQRIAERLAEQGATIALVGRTQTKLDNVATRITDRGGSAQGFAADVRDYDALASAIGAAHDQFGSIDILVCGAAGNFPAPAAKMSANAFKSVVDIDLLGTFNSCRAAYEHLTKPGASIINISAPQAFQPMAFQSHVCAAKAGVDMITRTLAIEWAQAGIRVNSIVPGSVADTEGMDRLAPAGPIRDALVKHLPLGRLATKDDIANMVIFLCSPAASYVTGAILVCDGGMSTAGINWSQLPGVTPPDAAKASGTGSREAGKTAEPNSSPSGAEP
ncbi:MAG TPA: SDR family oxidoreductase [Gemmatimonadaceae bacterium]|jgi:NAD(P)-dependent dehydrogenase (short-subunit alcohol dehydrogenase family)|nr:SDR family oxidoreductase [Gemmatimonadaceae bacterium]